MLTGIKVLIISGFKENLHTHADLQCIILRGARGRYSRRRARAGWILFVHVEGCVTNGQSSLMYQAQLDRRQKNMCVKDGGQQCLSESVRSTTTV